MASFSAQMDYSRKPKAVASRSTRLNVFPSNGSTFKQGQTCTIQMPQLARSFYNLNDGYLKMKITPTQAAAFQQSAYSCIESFKSSTNNGMLDTLEGFGPYMSVLLDAQLSPSAAAGVGEIMLAMGGDATRPNLGKNLGAGSGYVACLPLVHGLFGVNKSFPADTSSPLRFDIKFAEAPAAFIRNAHGTDIVEYVVSDVELIVPVTELSPDAAVILEQSFPDYSITYDGLSHTTSTKAAAATKSVDNLGCRYSSVNRILMAMRQQPQVGVAGSLGTVNRTTGKITEIGYRINGTSVPQKKIKVGDDFAEVMAENLIAFSDLGSRMMGNTLHGMIKYADTTSADTEDTTVTHVQSFAVEDTLFAALTAGDVAEILSADAGVGSFYSAIDLNTMPAVTSDSRLIAGISTLGSGIMTDFSFAGNTTNSADLLVDYWVQYSTVLNVDPVSKSVFVAV